MARKKRKYEKSSRSKNLTKEARLDQVERELDWARGEIKGLTEVVKLLVEENKKIGVFEPEDAEFLSKLKSFLGHAMENVTPPLDGAQIAMKSYVDDGIRRLAENHHNRMEAIKKDLTSEIAKSKKPTTLRRRIAGVISGDS